jgi:Protein of unknown function (DUF3500)
VRPSAAAFGGCASCPQARDGRGARRSSGISTAPGSADRGNGTGRPSTNRLQSPVAIFEFDRRPGVFLTNDRAMKFHIHTIVRTPNGNDYGIELIRRHERAAAEAGDA